METQLSDLLLLAATAVAGFALGDAARLAMRAGHVRASLVALCAMPALVLMPLLPDSALSAAAGFPGGLELALDSLPLLLSAPIVLLTFASLVMALDLAARWADATAVPVPVAPHDATS